MADLKCTQALDLFDGLMDGELPPLDQADLEAHLAQCPTCAEALRQRRDFRQTLKTHLRRYELPPGAAARFLSTDHSDLSSLDSGPDNRAEKVGGSPLAPPAPVIPLRRFQLGAGLLGAGLGAALAASLVLVSVSTGRQESLDRDLVGAHVRSLMPGHLMDVESSDRHTVKPWFNGRVDLSPPTPNLADLGTPLVGGRLDYVDEHVASVLIYRRHQHILNLFIWSDHGDDRDPGTLLSQHRTRNGYEVLRWVQDGVSYALVSDLNSQELTAFQTEWRRRALGGE